LNTRLLLLGVVLFATTCPLFAERPIDSARASQQEQQLRADIEYLASEDLRGRSVTDETIDLAANHIAKRMEEIGLDVTAIDGSPFQKLSITIGARPGSLENNRLVIKHREGAFEPVTASLAKGMNPMAIGSRGGQVTGPLVFAGYGITAEKPNYDDYAGIDVAGATVIMLRKEPGVSDPNSPFEGTRNTRHAFFATKIDNAIKHGAIAVILVNDPESVLQSVQNVRNKIKRELDRKARIEKQIANLPAEAVNSRKTLTDRVAGIDSMVDSMREELKQAQRGVLGISEAGERPAEKDSIPVVSLARDLIDQLVQQSRGQSLAEIEKKIDETYSPQSFVLDGVNATLRIELTLAMVETSNVIGVLDGRGPLAGETVVVGAHYDHVGMGGYGSLAPGTIAVHNGADDNASGTATLLATAAQLRERLVDSNSRRRIVFMAFTGEERGLLGSKFYVRNPRFPLESTVAMVNMDMVGRLRDNELTVYGTGSGDRLDEILDNANRQQKFDLFKVPSGYGPSDHQSFYEAGIPVLFFFTGLHNDYHRPSDDFDKIEFGGMTRITDIVSEVTFELATASQRPTYVETENRVQIRRQLTAYMGVTLSNRGDHVVLSGLSAGGPAERGGLRIGDRLEKLAKRRVRSASDVLEFMRKRSPGEDLQVQITRGDQTIDVTIRLQPRPGG
jgi:hypothetical protein